MEAENVEGNEELAFGAGKLDCIDNHECIATWGTRTELRKEKEAVGEIGTEKMDIRELLEDIVVKGKKVDETISGMMVNNLGVESEELDIQAEMQVNLEVEEGVELTNIRNEIGKIVGKKKVSKRERAVKRAQTSVRRSTRVNSGDTPMSATEKAEMRASVKSLELGSGSKAKASG